MNTNIINEIAVEGLKVSKLLKTDSTETLLITLEKKKIFPKHTSPKDALLVVLKGSINFYIENKMLVLEQNEIYAFEKNIEHYVTANDDSKFLIIR